MRGSVKRRCNFGCHKSSACLGGAPFNEDPAPWCYLSNSGVLLGSSSQLQRKYETIKNAVNLVLLWFVTYMQCNAPWRILIIQDDSKLLLGFLFIDHGNPDNNLESLYILQHVELLLCRDREISKYTRAGSSQRIGKQVPAATDTSATTEVLLETVFSVRSVYWRQSKVYVCCSYSDIWSVWFSETVIVTVLRSVTRKRLLKRKKTLCLLQLQWCLEYVV
jgi:hypothetical protein